MTKNQNDRFAALEQRRHNLEVERMTGESNAITRSHYERSDTEAARHNLAYEYETARHNVASENIQTQANAINMGNLEESIRTHKANEALGWANINEVQRHNTAVETETNRSNIANEAIRASQAESAAKQASASISQAAAATQNAATNQMNAKTNYLSMIEEQRHNRETETIQDYSATTARLNTLQSFSETSSKKQSNEATAAYNFARARAVPEEVQQKWVSTIWSNANDSADTAINAAKAAIGSKGSVSMKGGK